MGIQVVPIEQLSTYLVIDTGYRFECSRYLNKNTACAYMYGALSTEITHGRSVLLRECTTVNVLLCIDQPMHNIFD